MMTKHSSIPTQIAYEETIEAKNSDYYVANEGTTQDLDPNDIPTEVEVDVEIEAK